MLDKQDIEFIQEYASQAAGVTLSNALTAQTAMLAAILSLLNNRKPISAEELATLGNNAVDPLSRFTSIDDAVFRNSISSALRSYADGILKISDTLLSHDERKPQPEQPDHRKPT